MHVGLRFGKVENEANFNIDNVYEDQTKNPTIRVYFNEKLVCAFTFRPLIPFNFL